MSNEFKNEVFVSFDPNPVPRCSYCGDKPTLIRTVLDSKKGVSVQMFKCACGEQTWVEDKK